ncbi:hypothetical protein CDAR_216021 [Caerostris darwini]|uniref:Uncharacterized protein n=1 Tax=Caerostris darwini TaxID=1538125 RepID=A0AAV4NLG8_9ARAC|nr:hypothetical protein CDAR_216021 [Caerostris darwini]
MFDIDSVQLFMGCCGGRYISDEIVRGVSEVGIQRIGGIPKRSLIILNKEETGMLLGVLNTADGEYKKRNKLPIRYQQPRNFAAPTSSNVLLHLYTPPLPVVYRFCCILFEPYINWIVIIIIAPNAAYYYFRLPGDYD